MNDNNFFISTVRYEKVAENGCRKMVKEQYLVDALSFTEAEARTIEELTPYIRGEFGVVQIVKPRIHDLFMTDNASADRYYKVKYAYTTVDENTGVEKKTTLVNIVQATDFKNAYDNFERGMHGSMLDFEILSITETIIVGYYSYLAYGKPCI